VLGVSGFYHVLCVRGIGVLSCIMC
jgi:hypothetical protein